MAEAPHKRHLEFESLDDVVSEVESLIHSGYTAQGNWNLSQTCGHLNEWMRFPMDGFPTPPWMMRMIFLVMKYTVAKRMARKILQEGFQGGMPTAPETVPAADAKSDRQAADELLATIDRMRQYSGELHPSPLFGEMDQETWQRINLLHAAHHLGYLTPKTAA